MITSGYESHQPQSFITAPKKFITGRFQSSEPLGAIPSIGCWRDSQPTPSSLQGRQQRNDGLGIDLPRNANQQPPPNRAPETPNAGSTLTHFPSSAAPMAAWVHRQGPRAVPCVVRPQLPDYEKPTEADGNNVYDVTVQVLRRQTLTDNSGPLPSRVNNVNDSAPGDHHPNAGWHHGPSVNGRPRTAPRSRTVTATDAGWPDRRSTLTSIVGGADASDFTH